MKTSRVGAGRRFFVWLMLFAMASPAAFAQSGAPQVSTDPIGCIVVGQNALVQASIQSSSGVVKAKVFFKSALGTDYYYVEMKPAAAAYAATLPKAKTKDVGPLMYYVEATSKEFGTGRSAEMKVMVVADAKDCPANMKLAATGAGGAVAVFTAAGAAAAPAGFAGMAAVAGAAGFFGSTAGIVALGAVGAGAVTATAIAVSSDDNASPSK